MHPHSAYAGSMPPPSMPPHSMNGAGAGGAPPRMMMADGPAGNPPPPHIPRSSSASSHIMDVGPNGAPASSSSAVQKLTLANEQTWVSIGAAAETMEDFERALSAYESALRHNPFSVPALNAIAGVHRTLDNFEKAVDYFQRVLNIVPENGDTWGSMGHCYLMMDDLQRAYTAYQQALYHLPNPKEPKLWYGIGILYDRYGSLEHAEEAFASVVKMDPNYEKANEIYFRLGIIYKQQNKFSASLECFRYILSNPPRPLTEIDIWFQIGHVYEQQKDFTLAKEAYERVLAENPSHAKVLQQLGWLYHQSNAGFTDQERAIQFLTKSLESDPNDAQSWYLLGRAYMAGQNYNKAYEAYQQAVYRDGKNPTFWCSIGVLYYQINQFRDALDAYSRAIRLNPYISEVWFDLGSLYESCNNQISDAIDAYVRAAELDPDNPHIQQRIALLRNAEAKGEQVSSAPMPPQDVHPTAYANNNGMPPGPPAQIGGPAPSALYNQPPHSGPQLAAAGGAGRDNGDRDLPGPGHLPQGHSPPFRGAAPPPIPNIDDRGTRGPNQPLAPMTTGPGGEGPPRGGYPHSRGPSPAPRGDPYGRRMTPSRHSPPAPPPPMHDGPDFRGGPHGGPPPMDHYGRPMPMSAAEREREMEWERERERAARGYPGSGRATPKNEPGYARSQHGSNAASPAFSRAAAYPRDPRDDPREYYGRDGGPVGGGGGVHGYERPRGDDGRPPYEYERGYPGPGGARYDPMSERYEDGPRPPADLRGPTLEQERARDYPGPPHPESLDPSAAARGKARRGPRSKDELEGNMPGSPAGSTTGGAARKKKDGASSRASSPWAGRSATVKNGATARSESKGPSGKKAGGRGRDNASTAGSRRNSPDPALHSRNVSQAEAAAAARAVSPASSTGSNEPLAARGPSRMVDEDYDEGAADALMGLAGAASASASIASQHPPAKASEEPSRAQEERPSPRKLSDPERSTPSSGPPQQTESSLGKRPYDEEGADEHSKRAKNSGTPPAPAKNGSPTDRDVDQRQGSPAKLRNGAGEDDSHSSIKSPPGAPAAPSGENVPSPAKEEAAVSPNADRKVPSPTLNAKPSETTESKDMEVDEPEKQSSVGAGGSGGAAPEENKPQEAPVNGTSSAAASAAAAANEEEEGEVNEKGDAGAAGADAQEEEGAIPETNASAAAASGAEKAATTAA